MINIKKLIGVGDKTNNNTVANKVVNTAGGSNSKVATSGNPPITTPNTTSKANIGVSTGVVGSVQNNTQVAVSKQTVVTSTVKNPINSKNSTSAVNITGSNNVQNSNVASVQTSPSLSSSSTVAVNANPSQSSSLSGVSTNTDSSTVVKNNGNIDAKKISAIGASATVVQTSSNTANTTGTVGQDMQGHSQSSVSTVSSVQNMPDNTAKTASASGAMANSDQSIINNSSYANVQGQQKENTANKSFNRNVSSAGQLNSGNAQVNGQKKSQTNVTSTTPSADTTGQQVSTNVGSVSNIPLNAVAGQNKNMKVKSQTVEQQISTKAVNVLKQASSNSVLASAKYDILGLLQFVVDKGASDLHIVVGYPPMVRIDGKLQKVGNNVLTAEQTKQFAYKVLTEDKQEILEVNREVDLAYAYKNIARFRINAYYSKNNIAIAFRLIPKRIRTMEELRLPDVYKRLVELEQGFVLVTGPTGSGKSTTLASILQEINLKYPKHILTLEDPIEYVYSPAVATVTQREMGKDTMSWASALRAALRQDPDVVLVGEMRDLETIAAAITTAETGHLVFATLHTNSAAQTVDRMINVFPSEQQGEVRAQLAQCLQAVIAQRLVPIKGGGRRAVSEIMFATDAVRNLIREGKTHQLDNIIRTSSDLGMITMEKSLAALVKQGLVDLDEAANYATSPDELQRLINVT